MGEGKLEVIEIYNKCPGKERLGEHQERLDALGRKIEYERKENKEEIVMVEKTIENITNEMGEITRALAKLGFKILMGLVVFLSTSLISVLVFIYLNNIK